MVNIPDILVLSSALEHLQSEIHKLRQALILQKIDMQAEGDKPWDGKSRRVKNFIKWEKRPSEITKFKAKLPARLRAKIILPAPVKEFDPNELKTAQRNVIAKNLKHFVNNLHLTAQAIEHSHYGEIEPIVARCKRGDFIYDGNHRACINLLSGKTHRAKYIDLRNIDEIIKRLKDEDRQTRARKGS
jgi:hypothetical protein